MTGPTNAVERLLAETAWLQRLARSLVRGDDAADDVVQETLLRACSAPLAAVRDLRGWLATVAASVAARFARGERRRERRHAELPRRDDAPDVAEAVARTEAQQRVMARLLALPATYRDVLLLRFQGGLGYAGIAARLEVPIETVRTRIKRGLQQLRDQLDAERGGRAAWALPLLPRAAAAAWVPLAVAAGVVAVVGWFVAPSTVASPAPFRGEPTAHSVASDRVAQGPSTTAALEPAAAPRELVARVAEVRAQAAQRDKDPVREPSPVAGPFQLAYVGRVVDARTGLGIQGAEVRCKNRFIIVTPRPGTAAPPEVVAVTDLDGGFCLRATFHEHEELVVCAGGYATTSLFTQCRSARGTYRGRAVRSSDGVVHDLGTIAVPSSIQTSAVVVDGGGLGAAGAELWIVGLLGTTNWAERLGVADATGTWRGAVPHFAEATLWLVARSNGACGFAVLQREAANTIVLGPTSTLVVDCVDEHGRPVPRASLIVQPGWPWLRDFGPRIAPGGALLARLSATARADTNGRAPLPCLALPVAFDGVAVHVQATAEGHRGDSAIRTVATGFDTIRIVLPRGERGRVRVTVVDATTQQPIAGAQVSNLGVTEADGTLGIADLDVRDGVVSLAVRAAGYQPCAFAEAVGGRCDPLHVRIELQPGSGEGPAGPTFTTTLGGGTVTLPAIHSGAPRQPAR